MILGYKFKNFMSFRENVEFSMLAKLRQDFLITTLPQILELMY